jgi:hypothetical protein
MNIVMNGRNMTENSENIYQVKAVAQEMSLLANSGKLGDDF